MLPDWEKILNEEFDKAYYKKLKDRITQEYEKKVIYPAETDIFAAFAKTSFENTKVVIVGQDVYHGPGQAVGLSFAVNNDCPIPPSLRNIFKEVQNEYGSKPKNPNLLGWAEQGVLLLNSILTVEAHKPGSHKNLGWERFTDTVISKLNNREDSLAFLLWGNYAINKKSLIDDKRHLVLTSSHPSPLSANKGFLGCGHFMAVNNWLTANQKTNINWINS